MYKISIDKLDSLYALLNNEMDLVLPIKKANQVNYGLYQEGVDVSLDTLKTVKSPKDCFFPQFEALYNVEKKIIPVDATEEEGQETKADTNLRSKLSITKAEILKRPFIVFGMKACDVKAVEVLDNVFLSDPVDSYYKTRRENGTIVALACHEPEDSCFCSLFGIDAADPSKAKADVATWIIDGFLYWKALTPKGEALTKMGDSLFEDASSESSKVDEEINAIGDQIKALPNADLSLEGWGAGKTDEKFNSPLWEKLYAPCLGCGTCTFVCPTCQCYDIKDYETSNGTERYRCWDSCMYSDFTLMAGGQNRHSQMQRFRQRFMHKLVYYPTNYDGMYSCVGCGRCVDKCPQSLNIVKVIKAFSNEGEV